MLTGGFFCYSVTDDGIFPSYKVKRGEEMEDQEIIALFWDRDNSAIHAAQEKYGGSLLHLAERLLHSPQDAEECVNDAYLKAWNAIPPERPSLLFAYLAKVCRNLALDRLDWRNAQKRKAEVVSLTLELGNCIPAGRNRDKLESWEIGELMTGFLRQLPEEQRNIFLRRYWYADSIRDIAWRYGYGESKVKTTLMRLRNKLRSYLEGEGVTV